MNNELKAKLQAWLDAHFDELIADLEAVVAIPSVAVYDDGFPPYGKNCKAVLDKMFEIAEGYGLHTKNHEYRCGEISYSEQGGGINAWCHLDVVPAAEGWVLAEPFNAKEVGGWLIGRGVSDNKGPAIGVLYVLRALHELGIETKHPLSLCVGCDEEQGMSDVIYYSKNYPAAKLSLIADGAFPVGYAEKGIIDVDIVSDAPMTSVTMLKAGLAHNIIPDKADMRIGNVEIQGAGMSRHSAHPEGSVNAIYEMSKCALESGLLSDGDKQVFEYFKRINDDWIGTELGVVSEDEVSGQTSCVGVMASLTDKNQASMHINIRHAISADADKLLKNIDKSARRNNCHIENADLNGPAYYPKESPIVAALTRVFSEITGSDKEPYCMSGGTYARKLPNAVVFGFGGLKSADPAPEFKPGHGGAHQNDEALSLSSYKKALLIYAMGLIEADKLI